MNHLSRILFVDSLIDTIAAKLLYRRVGIAHKNTANPNSAVGNAHPTSNVLRKVGRVTTRLFSKGSSPELAEGSSSKSLPA
jgi:hypothetical protein